jgi:hypothetical protein
MSFVAENEENESEEDGRRFTVQNFQWEMGAAFSETDFFKKEN